MKNYFKIKSSTLCKKKFCCYSKTLLGTIAYLANREVSARNDSNSTKQKLVE